MKFSELPEEIRGGLMETEIVMFLGGSSPEQILHAISGVHLNWQGQYLFDENIDWTEEDISLSRLTLTGTSPKWNKIIKDKCDGDVKKFKKYLKKHPEDRKIFEVEEVSDKSIWVVEKEEKLCLFNGMHRTVSAILRGDSTINAVIGKPLSDKSIPSCENHLAYDLLVSYRRGRIKPEDEKQLIETLAFLAKVFPNLDSFYRTRARQEKELHTLLDKVIEIIDN